MESTSPIDPASALGEAVERLRLARSGGARDAQIDRLSREVDRLLTAMVGRTRPQPAPMRRRFRTAGVSGGDHHWASAPTPSQATLPGRG